VYEEEFEFCQWSENGTESIERLKEAHDKDMKFQHELLKTHVESINILNAEISRLMKNIKC
jgi:hypothetical protein